MSAIGLILYWLGKQLTPQRGTVQYLVVPIPEDYHEIRRGSAAKQMCGPLLILTDVTPQNNFASDHAENYHTELQTSKILRTFSATQRLNVPAMSAIEACGRHMNLMWNTRE